MKKKVRKAFFKRVKQTKYGHYLKSNGINHLRRKKSRTTIKYLLKFKIFNNSTVLKNLLLLI